MNYWSDWNGKKPCITLDTDFRIDELNGFPRAFVNFSLETFDLIIKIDNLIKCFLFLICFYIKNDDYKVGLKKMEF